MGWIRARSFMGVAAMVLVSLISVDAASQLAPTGSHYGGRPSDGGHGSGSVDASGGFSTSVPLQVPAARDGVPVPLQLIYGAPGVGAAGLGWDVPLSYVRSTVSYARRRPQFTASNPVSTREEVMVVLGGRSMAFGEIAQGVWRAKRDAPGLQLVETGNGWAVIDLEGRVYLFPTRADLGGTGIWPLESVRNADSSSIVRLKHAVTDHPGMAGARSIELTELAYNSHLSGACDKHVVALEYGAELAEPLATTLVEEETLVRTRLLQWIRVQARADCSSAPEQLRAYELAYAPSGDPDTGLPRLASVLLHGRNDPQASAPVTLATYGYGTATSAGTLQYEPGWPVILPGTGPHVDELASTELAGVWVPNGANTNVSATWQSLTDFTGDGRPDLVYRDGSSDQLLLAVNRPEPGGLVSLGGSAASIVPFTSGELASGPLEVRASHYPRFGWQVHGPNVDYVWRQAIDFNGDGRVDIIDAREEQEQWVLYLNTEGATPNEIVWVRRPFTNLHVLQQLDNRELDPLVDGYLPLSRRFTWRDRTSWSCERFTEDGWEQFPDPCSSPPGSNTDGSEVTFTEWQLADTNGDGYVDVVMNGSPVDGYAPDSHPQNPVPYAAYWVVHYRHVAPELGPANTVDVMLNAAGVRFDDTTPFADALTLEFAECGVEEWGQATNMSQDGGQQLHCSLTDVNGDRVLDRVVGKVARLGHGGGFTDTTIELPGPVSLQSSAFVDTCLDEDDPVPFDTPFGSTIRAGLRDLTGDGIPDYAAVDGQDGWTVAIGSGAGFAPPIPIDVGGAFGFSISGQRETCNGARSQTRRGLFDVDGDGRPEVVAANDSGSFEIWRLTGGGQSPRALDAGKLIELVSGDGASTQLTYRSAKDDALTPHQVPAPEVVVDTMQTFGTHGLGGTLASTRYAYGLARMHFDAARDAFVALPYGRSIALTTGTVPQSEGVGTMVITDTYGVQPFVYGAQPQQNFGRYLLAGRPRDVTTLAGLLLWDPYAYLPHDTTGDPQVTGVTHYEHTARLIPEQPQASTQNPVDCMDIMDPYDFNASLGPGLTAGYELCSAHGFAYASSTETWRGTHAPPATDNVRTLSKTTKVDDFGRTLAFVEYNDRDRSDDDLCYQMAYASSGWDVRTALATRRVAGCKKNNILRYETHEYDGLPVGQATLGRLTARTVQRRATETGLLLGTIRESDITYDGRGNPTQVVAEREDGAVRTTTLEYDPFGLVTTLVRTDGTNVPTLDTTYGRDPVSLDVVKTQDSNGTEVATEHDRFGRPVREMVRTPDMAESMVVSSTEYLGFDDGDPAGRRLVVKRFVDPVTKKQAETAQAKVTIVHLDELGRTRFASSDLGADYGGEQMITGDTTYDIFGRAVFTADPYLSSQAAASAYGTTHHFDLRGDRTCSIRGNGPQPFTTTVDEASERFPTCYEHTFANREEVHALREPSSLVATAPQAGTVRYEKRTAIGRLTARETWKSNTRLENAFFRHDALGGLVEMTRYRDAANYGEPVTWSARNDSLGRRIRIDEPEAPSRNYVFSDFGEILQVWWTDTSGVKPVTRAIIKEYDALGRLVLAEETRNGVIDAETEHHYSYDQPVQVGPEVDPRNTLGRLARAESPNGSVNLSYDFYGRVEARSFVDSASSVYVEKTSRHHDGSVQLLALHLPDNAMEEEGVQYEYDSAGRLRQLKYEDSDESRILFEGSETDPFGRLHKAIYGGAVDYLAQNAQTGRRLLEQLHVGSAMGTRELYMLGFDADGREKLRREVIDGQNAGMGEKTSLAYDEIGRLSVSKRSGPGYQVTDDAFVYDPLGNAHGLVDSVGTRDAAISYRSVDRDRMCRIGYGNGGLVGTKCNVVHDGVGNVVQQPVRGGGTRSIDYLATGQVRSIAQGNAKALLRYGPFGGVETIEVTGPGIAEPRQDRRLGAFIEVNQLRNGSKIVETVITRRFPGAGADSVHRRGANGDWYFAFGDARGVRHVADEHGAFVQDLRYQPFGEAIHTGAAPGNAQYLAEQWNGGSLLADFGINLVGARLYDPVVGRFLSRDPLMVTRTAASTNPYAFALNDPANLSDPTGLDVGCIGQQECSGGGGGGGPSVPDGGPRDFNWLALPQYLPGLGDGTDGRSGGQSMSPDTVSRAVARFAPPPQVFSPVWSGNAGLNDLSWKEKLVFDTAVNRSRHALHGTFMAHVEAAHTFAGIQAVTTYNRAHRFDGMDQAQMVAALNREQADIEQVNRSDRALLFGRDLKVWSMSAQRTGPVFARGMKEIWSHADPKRLARFPVGGPGTSGPDTIGFLEVLLTLDSIDWRPGMEYVLFACETAVGPVSPAQVQADILGQPVWGTTNVSLAPGNEPAYAPWGFKRVEPSWWKYRQ